MKAPRGWSLLSVVVAVLLVGVACSGRPVVEPPPEDLGVVAGRVFKGAVANSTVTVFRLENLERGAQVGSATTDAEGAFRVPVGASTGPFIVVASGGSFVDEATGVTVQLNTAELTTLIPSFDVATKLETVRVTPVSHLAAGLALFWSRTEGAELAAADAEAWQHLNLHFGALDWRTVTPTDVTTATGATLDEPTRQGLILAAFSMEARLIAQGAGLTPGGRVNPLTLTAALYEDVTADGFFDGVGPTGRLVLPAGGTVTDGGATAKALDGQTLRTDLAQGIAKFLALDRNVTAITLTDVQQLVATMSTNDDRRIFREASGPADIEPPVITFVRPAVDNAGVRGMVQLEVRAVDGIAVRELAFTAPASLVSTVATPAADGKSSVLLATLDVSSLPEGPVALSVRATDTSNNVATKSLTLQVSNRGPTITVSAPGDGSTINGIIALSASATAESGAIAKLELRNAPAGVGMDSLAAAADFGATWNTLSAPEGLVSLTFHAEDTLGGVADKTINVIVDNVAFGTVTTTATLGAPVGGLSVQLIAIDDATGLPVMGRTGGAVLGSTAANTMTDPGTGAVTFTLTQENYDGPVQLVAQGTTATYVDPTDDTGGTNIALPTSFTLSTYVRRYRTGDALNVPLTGWTTLADDAVLAYAQGKNPAADAGTLGNALTVVEPLFPAHVSRPTSWPLRTVFPVSLTTGTQSMRDVVFAALPDVGLNQLARDTAVDVGLTPGTGYGLPQLLGALRQDISDGLFDGRVGSMQLVTGGTTPYALDANTSRFKLAVGMDRFIRSAANATGLTRQDLQTSGIYDNVSGDTSILYPSSVAPIPFDNVAPTVTWTVKYSNGAQVNVDPYALGSVKLVAGVVAIEASAADSSGVQSVAVSLDGQPLSPGMGSSNALFKATFDSRTVADGSFTATAQSCDRLANCGSSTFSFETDNTQPNVSPAKPVPGFYSASFDIEALASDNTRLETFTLAAPAGAAAIADQDAQLNRVYAPSTSWVLAGEDGGVVADGPFAIAFRACDVVGNCTSVTSSPTIDRTPPTVNFATPPPLFTNQGSVTITITASDSGAGLSRVFIGLAGVQQPIQAAQGAGVWSATVPLATGNNIITIWGEDLASPRNSGQTQPAFSKTTTVFLDNVNPSATLANFAAYFSESGLTFQKQPGGVPVMPVSYVYQSPTKADLSVAATSIVKAASRLSWGPTTPTAAELEGANPRNVPFLQFQVPFIAGSESPLTTFKYRFNTSEGPTQWNDAIPAVRTAPNVRFFDLPITIETLPVLVNWGSNPRSFSMELDVRDQAGNSGGGFYQKTFQVVPPPVSIVRDAAYESRNDSRSIFSYRIGNQSYDDFFDVNNANFSTDAAIRHTRYVIYNPSDAPVAVSMRNAGSNLNGRTTETWTWTYYPVPGAPGSTYQTPDGESFRVDPFWDSRSGSQFTSYCGADPQFTSPCGLGSKTTHYPAHINFSGTKYTCLPIPLPNESIVSPPLYSGAGVFRAFRNAVTAPTGVENVAADAVSTGFVVPGATGGAAGTLAVYHASPRSPSPRGSAPTGLTWQPNPFDAASKYQFWQGDHFVPVGDGYGCSTFPERTTEKYSARRRYQQLVSSTTSFNSMGAIFATSGVTPAAPFTLVGGFSDFETQTAAINFQH